MTHHHLEAGADTVHWGYFDAALPPVLTVASGDTVTISTVSGPADVMPPPPFVVPEPLRAVQQHVPNRRPGHRCTGPVAVSGARAGQVLEVRIDRVELHYDWGYTFAAPLKGALPYEVSERHLMHIPLDRERMTGRLPWGLELPLRPFFGVMAVAPPPGWGMITTLPPRQNGGNLDNKELIAGTTLFLPIHVDEALFSVGDGHGVQGDGEVCVTAIETGLVGTFRLTVRDDMRHTCPPAETPTHVVTMAFDPDLDDCARTALTLMIDLGVDRAGLSRPEAYMLCSLAADLRVTQLVNGNNGVHCMLPKSCLVGRG